MKHINPRRIGLRVKNIRYGMGMDQEELAKVLGASKSAIAMIEIGQRLIMPDTAAYLARFAGVTLDYIYLGDLSNPCS